MHCWTAIDARPGFPRVVCVAINVVNSFKISTCSWLLWGPRSRAQLSLPDGFLCMSIPAVATQLQTTHRRPISLIHFPLFMSVMICWAIGRMIASSFDRICFGSIFSPWSLLFGLLGLAPKSLDSSTVAHRWCTISTHERSHTLLPNALYSSAPAFRPFNYWKKSMWWCSQGLHFWYHQVMHHSSGLCVCVPQIESVILLFFEWNLEIDYLLFQNETLSRWNILYGTLPRCRKSCRSFFAKEPLIIVLLCGKWPIKIRHPMGLVHPVMNRVKRLEKWHSKCNWLCVGNARGDEFWSAIYIHMHAY